MSGDYLADLRIRIEPGPGVVASLRGVLLVVPTVEPGQAEALDALLSAAAGRPVVRAVARVVADFDRSRLPGFCLVVEGEAEGPFALVHGAVVLRARGSGQDLRLSGLEARSWVDRALPAALDRLTVHLPGDGDSSGDGRLVLEATSAAEPVTQAPEAVTAAEPVTAADAVAPAAQNEPLEESDAQAGDEADIPGDGEADDQAHDQADTPGDGEADDQAHDQTGDPAEDPADDPADDPAEEHAQVVVLPSPAPAAGGGSGGFRPEPVRFGQGGRIEAVQAPPAPPPSVTVNGWHDPARSAPSTLSAPPVTGAPDPVAPEAAAGGAPPALPVRRPSFGDSDGPMPPQAHTQLLGPPGPGLFSGAVPPPVSPSFDPFRVAAPQPPQAPGSPVPDAARRTDRLGRLVMENGPDVVVDGDCVIGRNPEVDPDVARGRAKPIILPDAEQRISRIHARLVFGEDGVEIVDAGSVNGTWIEPPGGDGWIAMVPRVPAPLPLGSRIQVGDLVLSYAPVEDDA